MNGTSMYISRPVPFTLEARYISSLMENVHDQGYNMSDTHPLSQE